VGRQLNEFSPLYKITKSATSEFTPLAKERRCRTRTLKFTKAQRIFNREHMNRPLGEYQKNMIDGVLKKYGKYTVKRPIDKQTIRCLNSLVKRGLLTFDAETETCRLKPKPTCIRPA
jgi:hypothetical protein